MSIFYLFPCGPLFGSKSIHMPATSFRCKLSSLCNPALGKQVGKRDFCLCVCLFMYHIKGEVSTFFLVLPHWKMQPPDTAFIYLFKKKQKNPQTFISGEPTRARGERPIFSSCYVLFLFPKSTIASPFSCFLISFSPISHPVFIFPLVFSCTPEKIYS